jgi:hypothetical protein
MAFDVTHAQGELLAQVRPAGVGAVTLYQVPVGGLRTEITLLIAVVVSGTAGNTEIELFHDDDGAVYDNDSLIASIQRADNADGLVFQAQHPGSGIMMKPGASLGVSISQANAVNFSVYGITETLAERVRGLE